jgi:acetyl esterase/lipase/NRPS condensation-like uncharacterized protein
MLKKGGKDMKKFLSKQLRRMKLAMSSATLESVRKRQDTLGRFMARSYKKELECEEIEIGGIRAALLTPKNEQLSGIILYLHGGGYTSGNLNYAKGFGSILSARFGIRSLCLEYRLAPEHIFPAALDDAMEAYVYLVSAGYDPSQIILCGESAGGGLCYSLCQKLMETGRTLPAGIITVSPWTDLTASGDSYRINEKADPSMTSERLKYYSDLYVYGAESFEDGQAVAIENSDTDSDREIKRDPRMSPLFGQMKGMPPSLTFVGGDEIMLDDATLMDRALRRAGAESHLIVSSGMWHGYLLYNLKDSRSDFDRIGRFIKEKISQQKKLRWLLLDNAAKIFPASRKRNWNNVFRLSATFLEDIDRDRLSSALDVTVRRFPSIAVRIKTGMFWYYLEEIPKAPRIIDEKPYPLARMPFDDIRKCAFRVIVYNNRVAIEFFHAVTDGNGALVFFKTLLAEYLYQKESIRVPCTDGILDRLENPSQSEMEDSFFKYAGPKKASRQNSDCFKIIGKREVDGFKTNTTFILDADNVLAEARKRGVTVTAYLTAVLTVATMRIQAEKVADSLKQKPIKILIPVNLRKIFPSDTLRNFMLYARPGIDPALGEYDFDEICGIIYDQMRLEITPKNMAAMIATNVGSEKPIINRITPLFIKNIIMKLAFNAVGERKSSFSFSNLGVVRLPEELSSRIGRMDFVIGVQSTAPYNTSAVTYGGRLYLNVIRNISEPVLEREIHKVFREIGLRAVVESNTRGGK